MLEIKTLSETYIPEIGDKVIITDYEGIPGNDVAKLARLPFCIVEEVSKVPIGEKGKYCWQYSIYVKETDYIIGFSYKKYTV